MKYKFFKKIKNKVLIKCIFITLAIISFFGCSIYIKDKKSEAKSKYEVALNKYKTEVKKIIINEVSSSTLQNISLEFEGLSKNTYLSKGDKSESINYMNFTKYLAYREQLYETLTREARQNMVLENSKPNKFKNIFEDINKTLNNLDRLYDESEFIRTMIVKSPQSMREFIVYLTKVISNTSKDDLQKMIDEQFNKSLLKPEEILTEYNKARLEKFPNIIKEEWNKDYMKELSKLSKEYEGDVRDLDDMKVDQNSDSELINEYFLAWNSLLNKVWVSLQEHLPTNKLKEAEQSQLVWISSKSNKTKFEQAQMTKFRTLEIIKHYIYGQ